MKFSMVVLAFVLVALMAGESRADYFFYRRNCTSQLIHVRTQPIYTVPILIQPVQPRYWRVPNTRTIYDSRTGFNPNYRHGFGIQLRGGRVIIGNR